MLCVLLKLPFGKANGLGADSLFRFGELSCPTPRMRVQPSALQVEVVELRTKLPVRIAVATSAVRFSRRESRSSVVAGGVHRRGDDVRL